MRFCWRVITGCEAQKWELRAKLIALTIEEVVTAVLDPERLAELEELRQAINDEIKELERLQEAARELLRWLHREHGPIRWARADSPEGGAEKLHYTGATT